VTEAADTSRIENHLNRSFAAWEITLPPEAVEGRKAGHIFKAGWHIGYLWGEQDGELFLEYLAQHRHPGDVHVRVFASGRVEHLEVATPFVVYQKDSTEKERKRLGDEAAAQHRRVCAELRKKGLLPSRGQNLPALEINEYLRSGGEVD